MEYDEAFRQGIPPFLRRPTEAAPDDPMFMSRRGPGDEPCSAPNGRCGAPIRAASPMVAKKLDMLPWLARRRPAGTHAPPTRSNGRFAEAATEAASSPSPADGHDAPPAPGRDIGQKNPAFFRAARERIEQAFDAACEVAEEGDVAFQVTLPRSVIRQIRLIAAEEGTTHRAIVLRSLRLAGLTVPDGADVDRRRATGRRRTHGADGRLNGALHRQSG